jgi:hypothetical protein
MIRIGKKRKRMNAVNDGTKITVLDSDLKASEHGYTILSSKKFIFEGDINNIFRGKDDDKLFTTFFVK